MVKNIWLVFIDTNILLDFYRLPGVGAKRQLEALMRHQGSLILSGQVRMEFLKNRQKAIIDWLNSLKEPQCPHIPPIIADYEPAQVLRGRIKEARDAFKKIKKELDNILDNPKEHDPVFQGLENIFNKSSPLNLIEKTKVRLEIIQKAEQRFKMGYPPRKSNDTSIGDALNWEWLIHCAKESSDSSNILIVSRDSDFGAFKKKAYLNDWLQHEFFERVGKDRKIELTNKLTTALKFLDEHVAPEDLQAEEALLTSDKKFGRPTSLGTSAFVSSNAQNSNEELNRFLSNWQTNA